MGEEYFLSKQLSDKGLHTYYEPSIKVTHHCHSAIDKIPSRKIWEMFWKRIAGHGRGRRS